MSSLDDIKTSSKEADSNAAKTIALDHLGVIAARIRSSVLKTRRGPPNTSEGRHRPIKPLDEVG